MTDHSHVPAMQRSISDVVEEYQAKSKRIKRSVEQYSRITSMLQRSVVVGGEYQGTIFGRHASSSLSAREMEMILRKSAWMHIYKGNGIDKIAPASDRKRFLSTLETDPPELTIDNIRETFGRYIKDPRQNVLRGLAEAFVGLDQAYKSHSKVKIGVEGLPKRVIITGLTNPSFGMVEYHTRDRLMDILNALRVYQNKPRFEFGEFASFTSDAMNNGEAELEGLRLKTFKNGNAHLFFDAENLRDINRALAEFYGEVLPDTPDANVKKKTGTALAKDLQFYPTPQAVMDRVLSDLYLKEGKILEPSCGDGRFMEAIQNQMPNVKVTGIEVDAERYNLCRSKGLNVLRANFLAAVPNPVFDAVVMNPPFYGTHWKKHVAHALKFLKPTGRLIAILPASAFYDGHLKEWGADPAAKWYYDTWKDLPVASFAESGTNVPTGIFKCWAEDK